jgi:hypothetical protein
MGRIKKYITEEDKKKAVNERAMRYYLRNKEKIQNKNLRRYYENKRDL